MGGNMNKLEQKITKELLEDKLAGNISAKDLAIELGVTEPCLFKAITRSGVDYPIPKDFETVDSLLCDQVGNTKDMRQAVHDWHVKRYNCDVYKRMLYTPADFSVCHFCGAPVDICNGKGEIKRADETIIYDMLSNAIPVCNNCAKEFDYFPTVGITKVFEFESAHHLPNYDGLCAYTHGHTFKLEVTIQNKINPYTGFVMDFGKLKKAVNSTIGWGLDHGYLNDLIEMPSCENMLFWVWSQLSSELKGLKKIKIWETSGSYAYLTAEMVSNYILDKCFKE
jgi:6-pyruvoyltetrahydropterin/6-carboxytetrahydropterin synthase